MEMTVLMRVLEGGEGGGYNLAQTFRGTKQMLTYEIKVRLVTTHAAPVLARPGWNALPDGGGTRPSARVHVSDRGRARAGRPGTTVSRRWSVFLTVPAKHNRLLLTLLSARSV